MTGPRELRSTSIRAAASGELAVTAMLFWLVGATADKDVFDTSASLPWFLVVLFAGPHVRVALDRVLTAADGDPWEERRAFTSGIRIVLVFYALFTVVGIATARWIATGLFPGIGQTDRLSSLLRLSFFGYFLLGSAMLIAGGIRRHGRADPGWLGPIGHLVGAACALAAFGVDARVEDLAWGSTIGGGLGLVLVVWYVDRFGLGFDWATPWQHRSFGLLASTATPGLLVATLLGVEVMLPVLGGQFAGAGAVGALAGARWLVVGAVLISLASGASNTEGVLVPRRALVRSGLALGTLVGLATPLVGAVYGWGQMQPAAGETIALLLVISAVATPFATIMHAPEPAGPSRLTAVLLTAITLAALPAAVAAGRAAGTGAVASVWTLHAIALAVVLLSRAPTIGLARPDSGAVMATGIGGAAAMGASLGTAWIGETLGSPPIATALIGIIASVAAWAIAVRATGRDVLDTLAPGRAARSGTE